MTAGTARLIVVRHGNTFAPGEPPRRIGARTDLPLVESGRAQAGALRRRFEVTGMRFDRILTGPLARTRDTAALIAPGRALEIADWLGEIDHGPDEGRAEAEVVARIGAAALLDWDRHGTPPAGWTAAPGARLAAWRALLADARGTTLLVTSNGAARFALLADAALRVAAAALPTLKLRTGAWGEITVRGGVAALAGWDLRP